MKQSNVRNNNCMRAFLYVRLSRDDELDGESYSISNQKKLLTKAAKDKGYTNFAIFCDDGISGVTMSRPEFNKMIEQLELGNVHNRPVLVVYGTVKRFSANFAHIIADNTCDYFENYSRVKVIFSCRSEYFDCRYKKLFGEDEKNLDIFKLCTTDYDQRAVNKFFLKYSSYYKVPYRFSDNVHNKIRTSLFLMRIFFEVNSGLPYENLEFQNAEIYKQCIDKVASEHTDIDVNKIIRQISSKMIDSKCYDKVELSVLNLSNTEKNALLNLLDNNLLINKTIQLGVGISERTTEFLYFIFDEFRDFCIARELIIRDEDVIVVCVCIAKEGAMRMTISAYADDSIHIVIFLAAYYRLSHSKVLGLKWSAVDFEHNLIEQYICLC